MPDFNPNVSQNLNTIQQTQFVQGKPQQEESRTTAKPMNLASHSASKSPPSQQSSAIDSLKKLYKDSIKTLTTDDLQNKIFESAHAITKFELRGDVSAKVLLRPEQFKLAALKTELASRGVVVAKTPMPDDLKVVNKSISELASPTPSNHPWSQSLRTNLKDKNITSVQMTQNRNSFNVTLFRRDGGVQNIIVGNARNQKKLLSQVKLAKRKDDIQRNLSQLKGVTSKIKTRKDAEKTLENAKSGSYAVVPNPKRKNVYSIALKTEKGVRFYKMWVTDKGFKVQGKNETLLATNFDALVQTLYKRSV